MHQIPGHQVSGCDRNAWYQRRRTLEDALLRRGRRSSILGERSHSHHLDRLLQQAVEQAFRLSGLLPWARRNAGAHRLVEVEFRFPHLPAAFDGYRILHLSDLHVGDGPDLPADWIGQAARQADLAVITGDIQSHYARQPVAETTRLLAPLLTAMAPPDGVMAVLGNHDCADLAVALEEIGIVVLTNQCRTLTRNGQRIRVVGTDDVHFFYTPAATEVLAAHADGFRIALVHSPELAGEAAAAGYALYLTGHTHAGQVALPGGRPLLTMLDRHRALACGAWRHHGLQGFTSAGTGTGLPSVRVNTRPEAALIRLTQG